MNAPSRIAYNAPQKIILFVKNVSKILFFLRKLCNAFESALLFY